MLTAVPIMNNMVNKTIHSMPLFFVLFIFLQNIGHLLTDQYRYHMEGLWVSHMDFEYVKGRVVEGSGKGKMQGYQIVPFLKKTT